MVSGTIRHRIGHLLKASTANLLYVRLLIGLLSLMGIGLLLWSYTAENAYVANVFREMRSPVDSSETLTPEELVELSHRVSLLNTGTGNWGSFVQPMHATISEGGWCGNYVRVFVRFAKAQGYPAHKLHLRSEGRSHTLAEVYYEGQWRVVDPFFNQVYLRPDGELAIFEDLLQQPDVVGMPLRRSLTDPKLEKVYSRYKPIFPALYRDAADFDPALNGSALFHNSIVFLSYPLSWFYGGERRPIIPSWLDRPELLGTYVLSVVFLITMVPIGIKQFRNMHHPRNRSEDEEETWFSYRYP